jgi:hypothetical protein
MAKIFTSRGISAAGFRVFRAVVINGTAKFPSRKSRLIGKIFPFRGNSAEFPAGILT